jgi:hypothetical protein
MQEFFILIVILILIVFSLERSVSIAGWVVIWGVSLVPFAVAYYSGVKFTPEFRGKASEQPEEKNDNH